MSNLKDKPDPYCPDPDLANDIAECEALTDSQVDAELQKLNIRPKRTIDAVRKLIADGRRRLVHLRTEAFLVALALITSIWLRAGCEPRPWRIGRAARRCNKVWCFCLA